jgi:hypothetical protein
LLVTLVGSFFVAAALPSVGRWLAARRSATADPRLWTALAAVLLIVASLPPGLKGLHASRAGHRAAGVWLASNAGSDEQIIDPFRWAEFYAGRTLRSAEPANVHAGNVYVILEPNSPTPHSRLPLLPQAEYIARSGTAVYHWPPEKPLDQARVVVYRSPPVPFPLPKDFPQ